MSGMSSHNSTVGLHVPERIKGHLSHYMMSLTQTYSLREHSDPAMATQKLCCSQPFLLWELLHVSVSQRTHVFSFTSTSLAKMTGISFQQM